ncbi:beta-galactosidase [Bacteroides sp. 214]|nr:glycoside hydrolase family 2 TIM barrel-domain containing protein [Bacteroides sp. 214]NDW12248.1 beta-galactosidase [Bacteroides sp. 214]
MSLYAQQQTIIHYLSGRGSDDMVQWDFFCTDGRNAGKWSKIGVPSCWELQGFGTYQYGISFYGKPFPDGIANEKGMYKYEFDVPEEWRGKQINLIFEASMTDTEVKINGRKAGSKHQGAFYRFQYNVTDLLKYGKKNLLEATVSKESENASVNLAERRADYWNFGGIFRPVFLEVKPAQNFRHIAIDAKADGSFLANCYLNAPVEGSNIRVTLFDARGKKVKEQTTAVKAGGDWTTLNTTLSNPALWSAETPNLYKAQFELLSKEGKLLHSETTSFGFRTIEVRESDGMYVNGVRIMHRGVNRHSFRPESGRTLSKAENIADVLLMKAMNMNAVRLSHYPADPDFLYACDSLGLYVMDELGGWHGKYDTPTGKKLIPGMVERDVNHPSVIWWSNGNEKGWNVELDDEFHKYDPQKRPVIHPQGNFGGFETMHYRSYGESQNYMRLPEIFCPTEFLHGLYDGGHGAGLWDYWEMMRKHPRCIGGYLWVLADEGVKRVDMDGFIDNQGNYGADGIVGPHHEKEGSFYTIKEIWNPVQVMNKAIDADFDGVFSIENRYDFLNTNTCRFVWQQVQFPAPDATSSAKVLKQGELKGSDIPAHQAGTLDIKTRIDAAADALFLTAIDATGHELWRWSFPIKKEKIAQTVQGNIPTYTENDDEMVVKAADANYTFSKKDGQLKQVVVGGRTISFTNGPRFIAARRADRSLDRFYNHDDKQAKAKERTYDEFEDAGVFVNLTADKADNHLIITANYKLGCLDKAQWTVAPDGTLALDYTYNFSGVVELMGVRFDYPEEKVISKRWLGAGPYRVWQNRLHGTIYDVWENDYNDPIPGETFTYPEFKGYFANVSWMDIRTQEGTISITNETPNSYIGVYQPRDGRDRLLYTLPESGISVLDVIPAVRNKVNSTDLCGPSSQAVQTDGVRTGRMILRFK